MGLGEKFLEVYEVTNIHVDEIDSAIKAIKACVEHGHCCFYWRKLLKVGTCRAAGGRVDCKRFAISILNIVDEQVSLERSIH